MYDGEPEPGPGRACAELGLENSRKNILGNPRSVVHDRKQDRSFLVTSLPDDGDARTVRSRETGVLEKVDQNLLEFRRSRDDRRKVPLHVLLETNARRRPSVKRHDFIHDAVQGNRNERGSLISPGRAETGK